MALSPAQRHNARLQTEQQLTCCQPITGGHSLHLQIQALERDVVRLRDLPMTSDRVEMKRRELLPRWLPTVQAYLDSGETYQHPIFSYCVVWLFDVEEFDQGLDWADIAIAQGQRTPDNIKRSFAAFVADTMLEWAEIAASSGQSVEPYFSRTFKNVAEHWRLHEEITAKWFKFAGLLLLRDDNGQPRATATEDAELLQKADALLAQAEHYHRKVGVGTMRKTIAARLRTLQKS
ncbi:phage terminase small subunit [Candidatus Symbiopectobacterium sp. NZEC151]|uniref:phage terminase small subunit n=1 Tax=Candidatus Symbiopectobacterium sp. NZEC151 TaxID=2820470 RepID=UPI002226567F|nr:phage terminase small subunit [Candidatus Symbiopectobacterium sp. NZEC151]MCW2474676.1 terminase [Candidatus Symbiopectobacterium sp. NZEC151]